MSQIQVFEPISSGGMGPILTITGNSGGPVPPSLLGNINIIGGTGVTVVGDIPTNTLTINVTGGGFKWNSIVADTQLVVNNGYVCNNIGPITLTLPLVAAVGDTIRILGGGFGLFIIAQNANQECFLNIEDPPVANNFYSSVGVAGSVQSTDNFDAIDIICIAANLTFKVIPLTGSFDYL